MVEGGDESWSQGGESALEVVEVVGVGRIGEELVEDGEEVVEAPDRWQRRGVIGAKGAPSDGEQQGVADGLERDAPRDERNGEPAVGGSDVAGGAGRAPVEVEEMIDATSLGKVHAGPQGRASGAAAACPLTLPRGGESSKSSK
jgi:hypothetical protein